MGHSSGGHIEVEFLKHYCDLVKGQILFSPVDGVDPFGLIDEYTITPGQVSAVLTKAVVLSIPNIVEHPLHVCSSVCELRVAHADADGGAGRAAGRPRGQPHPRLRARGESYLAAQLPAVVLSTEYHLQGLGNMRFYDAMPAMTWAVNATQYGHGDVINELYYQGLVVSRYISTLLKLVCLPAVTRRPSSAGPTRARTGWSTGTSSPGRSGAS